MNCLSDDLTFLTRNVPTARTRPPVCQVGWRRKQSQIWQSNKKYWLPKYFQFSEVQFLNCDHISKWFSLKVSFWTENRTGFSKVFLRVSERQVKTLPNIVGNWLTKFNNWHIVENLCVGAFDEVYLSWAEYFLLLRWAA